LNRHPEPLAAPRRQPTKTPLLACDTHPLPALRGG
jgi:hypothetical protein